jgi:hypothetical protein
MEAALAQHLKSKQKKEERSNKQHNFAIAQDSKEAKDSIKQQSVTV